MLCLCRSIWHVISLFAEDDVLSTPIPIVKHTYSHHQTTPMSTDKDKIFDDLFFSAHSTPPSLPEDEHIGLNESCK
jgi:hypothetical protein